MIPDYRVVTVGDRYYVEDVPIGKTDRPASLVAGPFSTSDEAFTWKNHKLGDFDVPMGGAERPTTGQDLLMRRLSKRQEQP